MKDFLQGQRGGLLAFLAICLLVVGGLGWVTRATLALEREQLAQQGAAEHAERLRLALWRLDSRVGAILAREDSRPFSHYSAIFAPSMALDGRGIPVPPGSVLEPSPLLNAELPTWMLLHFQVDDRGWESPQALSPSLKRWLSAHPVSASLANVTPARHNLLAELNRELTPEELLAQARRHTRETTIRDRALIARSQIEQNLGNNPVEPSQQEPWRDYMSRRGGQSKLNYNNKTSEQRINKELAVLNFCRNGEEWLHTYQSNPRIGNNSAQVLNNPEPTPQLYPQKVRVPVSSEVPISMSPLVGVWVPSGGKGPRLLALRLVHIEQKEVCQGIVLDGERLRELLAEEVQDLFPGAGIGPSGDPSPELLAETMTTLPLRLLSPPRATPQPEGWTTLRLGLCLAWAAALVALVAVGLGGWSLIDLSARRIRFVSAVTHELRTPLTTLRLYLDLLLGGMVRDDQRRQEYLRTLEGETDRLTRLVGNVLDFSRLENQRHRTTLTPTSVSEILERTETDWRGRCANAGKQLVVENEAGAAPLLTDAALLGQILANLIDNACKYSREAPDARIWLRGRRQGGKILFEVEDRGPGVPTRDRQLIFRPFRRGQASDATTGGVGLGLALADRWARLLRGRLLLWVPASGGAGFRVEFPLPRSETS